MLDLSKRPRRLRRHTALRNSVAETRIAPEQLILPVFLVDGRGISEPISSMPGVNRFSLDNLLKQLQEADALGLGGIALFPKIQESLKDSQGREALNPQGLVPNSIRAIKKAFPNLMLYSDIALDPFSSDGHDGIVRDGKILNDETVAVLAKMAVVHAEAGVDFVAPSDMMDGRVGAIRRALDGAGFQDTGILAYSAKYASSFYGPFRDALDSAPRAGDKKTYQMDPRNAREALREAALDVEEGADMLMVKPAGPYLDIIHRVKAGFDLPVAAYQVSGEYSLLKLGAAQGILDWETALLESLHGIRRAGADLILTYAAIEAAKLLRK